jgi:phosphoglycolate phosphatase
MKRYNTVIFDLDGTLLNTLEDLTDAVNFALESCAMPKRTIEEVRQFVGNGIRKLMLRAVPRGEENADFERAYQLFQQYYKVHCNDKTKPYPGIIELLDELKKQGYHLAIVSNKADFGVKELQEIYFKEYITTAIGEKEGIRKKPAPDTVEQALRELGMTKEAAIYVGDSDVDIQTAKNAGLPCISVTWGFRSREFLEEHGAECFADDTEQLLQLLG